MRMVDQNGGKFVFKTSKKILHFIHVILQSLDDGHSFARVFFADFSKGFDLVDHNALVLEMQCLGVHEATIRWISSFLTDRIQRVKIEGVYSDSAAPRGGIPQGLNWRLFCSPFW